MESYKKLYEAAKKKKALKLLTPDFHKWQDTGEVIVGAFVSRNPVQGKLGGVEYNQYIFETDDGLVKFSMGAAADREVGDLFVPGAVYSIEYLGKESISGGRSVNKFNVIEIGIIETGSDADTKTDKDGTAVDTE
jgi:hypothetical protein